MLLGIGWAVEQLWQQWQPASEPPWLSSYSRLLQQSLQQPPAQWQQLIPLTITAQPLDSISWLAAEQQRLQDIANGKPVSIAASKTPADDGLVDLWDKAKNYTTVTESPSQP